MFRFSRFAALAVSMAACAGRTTPASTQLDAPVDSAKDKPAEKAQSKTRPLLVVPPSQTASAPWAEAIDERSLTLDDLGTSASFLGASDDFGTVWTRFGVFLVEHERGVVDRLDLPKGADWVGFDERGAIAGGGGTLWRAADPRGDWAPLAMLEGAASFDASVGTIVASDGRTLWVSTDGGASFSTRDTPLTRIENVVTRPDGAIVIQGADDRDLPATFTGGSGSSRWNRTETEWLSRRGSQIREGDGGRRTLARDGRQWVESCWDGIAKYEDWLPAYAWPELGAPGAPVTLRSPLAPTHDDPCRVRGLLGTLGEMPSFPPEPLRGTTGAEPVPTDHLAGFLSDGLCATDADGDCTAEPAARLPHVVRVDGVARTARVSALPSGCSEPQRIDNAFGASVLICETGRELAVFTLDDRGWYDEGKLALPLADLESLTAARDGTLLLHGSCAFDQACAPSFVRDPVAFGEVGAWRRLEDPLALTYRVLTGGRVLRVSGGHDTEYELAIVDRDDVQPFAHIGIAGKALTAVDVEPVTGTIEVGFQTVAGRPRLGARLPAEPTQGWIAADGRTLVDSGDTRSNHKPIIIEGHEQGLAPLGDFNGDAMGDLAIGTLLSPGRVSVLLGGPGLGNVELAKARDDGRAFDLVADDDCCTYLRGVAAAGDVNGDGLADVLVTVVSEFGNDEVRTYVVFGRKTIGDASLAAVERGEGGFTIRGGPADAWSHEIAGVGDLDGDGLDDIAIGDYGNGHSRVYVVYGKKDQEWVHLGDAERGVGGFVLRSEHDDDRFGMALTGIPDIDGDGKDELAVGAPGWAYDRGRVWIVRGASRVRAGPRAVEDLAAQGKAVVLSGARSDDRFGSRLLARRSDALGLVVAATTAHGHDSESGRVYVLPRRRVLDPPPLDDVVQGKVGFAIDGDFADDRLGQLLAAGPDGLLVGSASARRFGRPVGGLWRVSGPRHELVAVDLPGGLGGLGSVFSSPDVDGDGKPDLVARMYDRDRSSSVVVILGGGR